MRKKITLRNKIKKFIRKEIKMICLLLVSFCVCLGLCVGIFFLFIKTNELFAANFADQVLRPMIGSQATVDLEAFFFSIEDNINQIAYHFIKPKTYEVVQETPKQVVTVESLFSLEPITSLHFFSPLVNEGRWIPIETETKDTVLAKTFVRPDKTRSYAIVTLVKMNMNVLDISAVGGTWEPAEVWKKQTGMIPLSVQKSNLLLAAFNGGFQKKDGEYGMVVGDTTLLPLQKGLATLVMYKNAKPQLINYTGQKLGANVVAMRQNGPLILANGKIVTSQYDATMKVWGLTTTNSMYTWRSGLGITKNGNLVYAVGPSLVPETLAKALQSAGAVNGMQLDINPVWVRFVVYSSVGNGKYTFSSLLEDMVNGGASYLTGYQKDFFYIYKKS